MITNERQYKITKSALAQLDESIKRFDIENASKSIGNRTLAEAELRGLESEREVLSDQLKDYELLKSGAVKQFEAQSLEELPDLLVKARISKGLSQRDLAERLSLKEQQIQRYESEKYAAASLRRIVEIADALGLNISKHARLEATPQKAQPLEEEEKFDLARFPLKEMYQRGWFADFRGSFRDAEASSHHLLHDFLSIMGPRPIDVLYRMHVRGGSRLDSYALLAWECRAWRLAEEEHVNVSFDRSRITEAWLHQLIQLSVQENGARLAKEYLKDAGIALVVEPHLSRTYLDGASFLMSKGHAVIGLTLRYDRLDNFWFVLLHEIAHLILHARATAIQQFFDDLDAQPDEVESQADQFASETLVPSDVWETSVARYVRSAAAVKSLAGELGISPALVAGKIRKEAENYIILKELIGVGAVRAQFPEVKFGQ